MGVVFRVLLPALLGLSCIPVTGCSRESRKDEPSVQFTTIPPAAVGGSERVAPIGGRATGIRPGQRIVIYTKSGVWWVQPLTSEPFTTVGPNGTWENTIHLGMEYAALLVDAGYRPADTRDALPPLGGGVIAIASVKGTGDLQTRASKVLTSAGMNGMFAVSPVTAAARTTTTRTMPGPMRKDCFTSSSRSATAAGPALK
jgi:hypothetical protein